MVRFIVFKYKIIITLILFCFFQTNPSISLELKIPKIGDLKKITEDIKKELEKKEPEVKKEEVSRSIKILLLNQLTSSSPVVYTIEHDLKNNNGLMHIEVPKKYADQAISFDYKVLYDHIKVNTEVEVLEEIKDEKPAEILIENTLETKEIELTKDQILMSEYNEYVRYIEIGLTELFDKLYVNDKDFIASVKYKPQVTDDIVEEIFKNLHDKINKNAGSDVVNGQGKSDFYNLLWSERKEIIVNALNNSKKRVNHCYPSPYGNCKGPEILKNNDGSLKSGDAHKTVKKILEEKYNKYKDFVCIINSEGKNSCENPDPDFVNAVSNKLVEIKKDLPSFENLIRSGYYVTLKYFPIKELKQFEKVKSKEFEKYVSAKVECKDEEVWFNKKCINKNKQYDTFFLAKIHDQAISNGKKTFTFLDGKSYKTQPKRLISKAREENEFLFLAGQREFKYNNSRVEGQSDIRTIKVCDFVYCDDTEIINNNEGYIIKQDEAKARYDGQTRKELFDRLYGKRINEQFARSHDSNLSTGGDIEKLENELKDLEYSKTKGFIGVQAGLLVKEQFTNEGVQAYIRSQMGNHQNFVAVRGVLEGGPASRAGIQSGDILLEIDGEGIGGKSEFKNFFRKNHSKTVSVKVWKSWENCNCGTLDNPAEGWRAKKEITTEIEIGSAEVSDNELWFIEELIKQVKSDLKKAKDTDKTFEFSITGSSTDRENYPVGRYPLRKKNNAFELNAKKINTLRDFIGNEVKLLVNERHEPYRTNQIYSNEERIWTIKFHDLGELISLRTGKFYAGRYSIEIFDDKKKEASKGPSGHYIFYKD